MKRILAVEEIPSDVLEKSAAWQAKRRDFNAADHSAVLNAIFREVLAVPEAEWHDRNTLQRILTRFPKDGKGYYLSLIHI